jgi:23S rRNA G2445 N2-methylase RlmL
MSKSKILVTCAKHTSEILAKEITALGFTVDHIAPAGVETFGSLEDCMKLNLHLRTGYKVLWMIDSFFAAHPDKLYKQTFKIDWEKFIDPQGYISINSHVQNEHILDTRFANLKVKDAIVDKMTQTAGKRPDSGPNNDKTVIFLHWKDNQASIFLDTSGETIARHGYRKIPFKAPMIEALAAANILSSQWDNHAHFVNPMCGSGTLAIEAALLAINKAPGLLRDNFGFMHIKGYEPSKWEALVSMAKKQIKSQPQGKIIASDIDKEAIGAAKINASYAGVADLIEFQVCDFTQTQIPEGEGVVMLNPEYGERLGEEKELEGIYSQIGDFFKQKCKGYMGYVFTGNLNLAKKIGLKTKRRMEFYNGKINCRLLEYELYAGSRKGNLS